MKIMSKSDSFFQFFQNIGSILLSSLITNPLPVAIKISCMGVQKYSASPAKDGASNFEQVVALIGRGESHTNIANTW